MRQMYGKRMLVLGMCAVWMCGVGASVRADWRWHTIPKEVPAVNVQTGQPMFAPAIPYGHYADPFYLHGTARHMGLDQHAAAVGSHLQGIHGGMGHGHGHGQSGYASDGCTECGNAGVQNWGHGHSLPNLHPGGLLHGHQKMKWFVGPGGPVPLTPGYVPYINTTRSPRDFFAFPPFADNVPY